MIAHRGDTFRSIGEETRISYKKLAKYNERDKNTILSDGDIVYLAKKRTKADKVFKKKLHTVTAGESMYGIAQQYGIRLKSLYKMNQLPSAHQLSVGERLRIY